MNGRWPRKFLYHFRDFYATYYRLLCQEREALTWSCLGVYALSEVPVSECRPCEILQ